MDVALSEVPISHEDYDYACRPSIPPETGLHVCPACGSKLVQSVHREEVSPNGWRLWRRCPECLWASDGIHDAAEIDDFVAALRGGFETLNLELRQRELEGMHDMVGPFSAALRSDLITADDFGPH